MKTFLSPLANTIPEIHLLEMHKLGEQTLFTKDACTIYATKENDVKLSNLSVAVLYVIRNKSN